MARIDLKGFNGNSYTHMKMNKWDWHDHIKLYIWDWLGHITIVYGSNKFDIKTNNMQQDNLYKTAILTSWVSFSQILSPILHTNTC